MLQRSDWCASLATLALAGAPASTSANDHRPGLDHRFLRSHNAERALIGVPSLVWDDKLVASARAWANHLSRTGRFEHSPRASDPYGSLGENIWAGTPDRFSPEQMVNGWVREKEFFRPGVFPNISRTGRVADVGHYTQVVWRRSRSVGCALAPGPEADVLVCHYAEGGNVLGERPF